MTRAPDYLAQNRAQWDAQAVAYAASARAAWSSEPTWGIWHIPDRDLGLLHGFAGDAVELGCGTGYVSSWLARQGARPVGVDLSRAQLATAQRMQHEFGLAFPLVHAAAEATPLRAAAFDLVVSEYGAAIWSDPFAWIPEAARLLRPGGELIFLGNANLLILCVPDREDEAAGTALLRPYFGLHRVEWSDDDGVEFHMPHGEWIRLLRANGFTIEDLIELRAPAGARTEYAFVDPEWARHWPSEQIWRARKT